MNTLRAIILAAAGILAIACTKRDLPEPEPVSLDCWDEEFTANSFHQGSYYLNSLELTSRRSDGMMIFSVSNDYTSVGYQYSAPNVSISPRNHSVTTDVVPEGQYETHFHFEIPMTAEASIPKAFYEMTSFQMDRRNKYLIITLAQDFPFAKAIIENATITFPAWVDSDKRIFKWTRNHLPGKVYRYDYSTTQSHTMQEAKAFLTEEHILNMDATIILDGTIRVEEADRKNPAAAASPWSATFLIDWESAGNISSLTGKMNLDKSFRDQSLTYAGIPSFMEWKGLIFDLKDVHAEVRVRNEMEAPISVSGVLMGDEREYPFGSDYGQTPVWAPAGGDEFHILFSENGREGEIYDIYGEPYTDRVDYPIPAFSGFIDANPRSFGLKDIRIHFNPEQEIPFHFDRANKISVNSLISSKLMFGKNFQFQTHLALASISRGKAKINHLSGSFLISNSLPFDFEVTPFFTDSKNQPQPIQKETIHVPAGSWGSPAIVPVNLKWESKESISARVVGLDLTGRMGKRREGEAFYNDQQLTVTEISIEVY